MSAEQLKRFTDFFAINCDSKDSTLWQPREQPCILLSGSAFPPSMLWQEASIIPKSALDERVYIALTAFPQAFFFPASSTANKQHPYMTTTLTAKDYFGLPLTISIFSIIMLTCFD